MYKTLHNLSPRNTDPLIDLEKSTPTSPSSRRHKNSPYSRNSSPVISVDGKNRRAVFGKDTPQQCSDFTFFVSLLMVVIVVTGFSCFIGFMPVHDGSLDYINDQKSLDTLVHKLEDIVVAELEKVGAKPAGVEGESLRHGLHSKLSEQLALVPIPVNDNQQYIKQDQTQIMNFDPKKVVLDALNSTRNYTFDKMDIDDLVEERAQQLVKTWMDQGSRGDKAPGYYIQQWVTNPPWPYQLVKDAMGQDTGIVIIGAPFEDEYYDGEAKRGLFWQLKRNGHIMLGISSYEHFPGPIINPYDSRHSEHASDYEIHHAMDGWMHCFRDPLKYLPAEVPRVLISESDQHNPDRNDAGGSLVPSGAEKEYDLIHVNLGGGWNDYNRNWTLTKACINKFVHEMDLKILIVGHDLNEPDLKDAVASGKLLSQPRLEWRDLLKAIEKARVMFMPNIVDASPRILVEALCLNVPALVNRNILGGWKYVNDKTGLFFDDDTNVIDQFKKLTSPEFQEGLDPRNYYKDNYGPSKTAVKLQAFVEMITIPEQIKIAKEVAKRGRQLL